MTKRAVSFPIVATTVAASFGFGIVQLDVTIVNVALPTIARELGATLAGLQWVVDAYALVFAALLLTGGYIGDRWGAKRGYLGGIVMFALASSACGLAPNAALLIAGRMLQGVGAAMMLPCSLALINHAAAGHPERRAMAIGWWTAVGGIAVAAGPIIGGLLIGVTSWRSIFLVNLPICAIAVWLTLKCEETPRPAAKRGFDVVGQLLSVIALSAVIGAVIEVQPRGFENPLVWICASIGAAAAIAFVCWEAQTEAPMLPLSLFKSPIFCGAVCFGSIANFTYYGIVFVLSLYLQRVLDYTPLAAGLAFLPLTATFLVVNIISGWWVGKAGSRAPMITGALIDAMGFSLLAIVATASVPYWQLAIAFVMMPGGMGLGVPAMTTAVLANVERERSGIAAAVLNAARQAAGAMGVALFGALAGDEPHHVVAGLKVSAAIAAVLLIAACAIAQITIAKKKVVHA
ncbi:MFS transporter [Bordetella sp. FB-8]|uniref:MFS transporter n=1 Tax=Bordetella sp. FB-8 TaxID=1159870 RepID=UPI000363C6E4|nr:MFS transporter [Bordetella sp. FB-8]